MDLGRTRAVHGVVLVAVFVPPVAQVLAVTPPSADGWMLILGWSLLPVVAGPLVHRWAESIDVRLRAGETGT